MKLFVSFFLSLLLSASAFSQNGVYLFGSMNNAPGTTFDISVVIYSTPPVTTQFTVNPDGSITNNQNYWVDLPSSDWTHFEVIYPTCENETNILTVLGDSLPNMIDVQYEIDYCPSGNEVYGCTDPEALNYNPEATIDDGSCEYEENTGCVDVNIDVFCVDTLSAAYDLTIAEDPFCCENQWDQLCQTTYADNGGLPLPGCEGAALIYGCTDPNAINYNPNADIDDGSCQYDEPDSCNANSVEVLVVSGQWGQEMSWVLFHEGDTVAADGAYQDNTTNVYPLCLEDGCYTFEMYDSFGDGWNGGNFSIFVNGFGVANGSLEVGEFGYADFGINDESCDSTNVIYGCTDPTAINYDPNATVDNGSCEYNSDVANDLCANATALQLGTQPISNVGAINNENIWGECWAFGSGEGEQTSIWYSFTTPDEPATIHIEASGDGTNTLTDTQFGLFEECGGEMIYCDGNAGQGLFSAFHFNCGELEENTTYILMIDGYFGDNGTANLTYDFSTFCDVLGCTDPEAINYDPNATVNDGSCEYEAECTWVNMVLDGPSNNQGFFDIYAQNGYVINGTYGGSAQTYEWCLEDGCFEMLFVMNNGDVFAGEVVYTLFIGDSIIDGGTLTEQTSIVNFGINASCDSTEVYGCTDPEAINYSPEATADDGSCEYEEEPCSEITMVLDSPSNISGTWDLYSEDAFVEFGTYDGTYMTYTWCLEDGCYDLFFVMGDSLGVMDDEVVYTIYQGDSILANGWIINNTSVVSFGVNSYCGEEEVYGCTDPEANNFNPNATIDDGSCEYEEDCTDVTFSFNSITTNQGSFTIYSGNEYVTGGQYPGGQFSYTTCLEDGCYNMLLSTIAEGVIDTLAYTISIGDSVISEGIMTQPTVEISFGLNADCEEVIYGCTDPAAINYDPNATIEDGSCEYGPCEDNELLVIMDTQIWGNEISWNIVQDGVVIASQQEFENNATTTYPVCLEDGCYTFEMFDSFGDGWNGATFTIMYNGAVLAEGTLQQGEYGTVDFGVNSEDCGDAEIYGCTDPNALNYNPNATIDDGSCEYSCTDIDLGFDYFNGAPADSSQMYWTMADYSGEVVEYGFFYNWAPQYELCLEDGCYTLTVFNVSPEWDGIYNIMTPNQVLAQGTFNGDESTFVTTFGVNTEDCDEEEVFGCTDPNAINFNPNATIDDGSCEYQFECAISFSVTPDTTGAQVIWITPTSNIANAVEVEWDFGDGTTSNDLFPIHTYEGDGPYTLCLTAYFEEPNGGFCEITYCAVLTDEMINPPGMQSAGFSINVLDPNMTTGLDELEQISGLTLWPNPATDQANIEFTLQQGSNVNIEVYDVAGKMVASESIAANTGINYHPVDVSDLRPGMYVVRLTGNSEQLTTRMVIQ